MGRCRSAGQSLQVRCHGAYWAHRALSRNKSRRAGALSVATDRDGFRLPVSQAADRLGLYGKERLMSRSLLALVEALEKLSEPLREPVFVLLNCLPLGDQLSGYSWNGGSARRKPGESDDALLARAERESLAALQPSDIIVLR